jgi:hypothetical protein
MRITEEMVTLAQMTHRYLADLPPSAWLTSEEMRSILEAAVGETGSRAVKRTEISRETS